LAGRLARKRGLWYDDRISRQLTCNGKGGQPDAQGGHKIMAVVKELIRTEDNGAISFGDYELAQKAKVSDFQHQGDIYKVKTFREITKLERNGAFVYESVPGTAVFNLVQDGEHTTFTLEGAEDAQVTVGLEADTEYKVELDGTGIGRMKTNLGGKLSFSAELENIAGVEVKIAKC
jgi:hypothetical protein